MPSFFERMRRLVSGEDVYRPGEDSDEPIHNKMEPEDVPEKPEYPHTAQPKPEAPKPRPQVIVERTECRIDGPNMEVTLHIQNMSDEKIMFDKVFLFNKWHELDRLVAPGIREEFVNVYYGPRPNHRNYTHCEVQYYRESDDNYFSALHNVEFKQEADKTYTINRIRFLPPVKDI